MKNHTVTPLSTEGSFEKIVNERTQKHRTSANRRVHAWLNKTLWSIVILLGAELINIILWLACVVPTRASMPVSIIICSIVSFLAGRLYTVLSR